MHSKYILKIIIFLSGLVLLFSAISFLIKIGAKSSTTEQDGKINRLINHELDPEIMIFGASVALHHFNSELIEKQTGLTTFNMGEEGALIQNYGGLVKEFASYSTKCKLVVLAIGTGEFEKKTSLNKPERFYHHIDNHHIYESLHSIDSTLAWRTRYIPFYSLIHFNWDYFKNIKKGYQSIIGKSPEETDIKGFQGRDQKWQPKRVININDTVNRKEVVIDYENYSKYKEIIEILNKKGIRVLIVLTPAYRDYILLSNVWKEYKKTFNKILSKSDSNLILDFSESSICDTQKLFYDNNHLNTTGANVFSLEFSKKINEIKNSPINNLNN